MFFFFKEKAILNTQLNKKKNSTICCYDKRMQPQLKILLTQAS